MRWLRCAGFLPLGLAFGCDWTVTNDPPQYDDLEQSEQAIVDRILGNMARFHASMLERSGPGIDSVLLQDAVQVHFHGIIMAGNFGDDFIRISIWDHLTGAERELIAGWWQLGMDETQTPYERMFYDYLATHLAAIQWIYEVQDVNRVLNDRPRFNVERDAQRLVTAFFKETDITPLNDILPFCQSTVAQFDDRWGSHYDDDYFTDHLADLANPEDPSGYFYFFCRWAQESSLRAGSLSSEMDLIKSRFGYTPP
jgi:hypothetical protein